MLGHHTLINYCAISVKCRLLKDSRFCVVFIIGHSVRFCQVFVCVFGRFFVHLQSIFPPLSYVRGFHL